MKFTFVMYFEYEILEKTVLTLALTPNKSWFAGTGSIILVTLTTTVLRTVFFTESSPVPQCAGCTHLSILSAAICTIFWACLIAEISMVYPLT